EGTTTEFEKLYFVVPHDCRTTKEKHRAFTSYPLNFFLLMLSDNVDYWLFDAVNATSISYNIRTLVWFRLVPLLPDSGCRTDPSGRQHERPGRHGICLFLAA